MKYSEFFKLLEKKDHLINKLTSLTDKQKQEVIAFFTKHPNYESEIDWNRKDLEWEDFEEVIFKERVSRAQLKNFVKKDKHFLVLYSDENCVLFQPLTWLGSRYLASTDVKPKVEGKWCISYQRDRHYWDNYSLTQRRSFIILCTPTTKWALEISPGAKFAPWNIEDKKLTPLDFYNEISKEVPDIKILLRKYINVAISNHSLVEDLHEKDLEECAYIEKVKEEERLHRAKIFPKSFKKQVWRKGYYEWNGDITYQDLKDLSLIDKEIKVDERFKYFKISGDLKFEDSPITSITIPDSITSIGDFAFAGCKSLIEIAIPEGVTSIGKGVFCGCESLKEISIPKSVTYIDKDTFYGCSDLESVVIPDSVTSIGEYAFFGCMLLKEISISESVTSIGDSAFAGCTSLTEITIPDNVTEIGDGAFSGCSSLISINIPDSITSISNSAFYRCYALTEITIPDRVTSIGDEAFSCCSSLTSVTFPDSVTSIGDKAFYCCLSLTSATIGKSVTSIGDGAFWNCFPLTEITIPGSVTSIGSSLFLSCKSLKAVYIDKERDSLDLSKADIPPQTKIYWKGEF